MMDTTRTRLAALLVSPALLLAGCGGDHGADQNGDAPSMPLGFELAMAGTSANGADDAAGADNAPLPAPAPPMIDLTPEQLAARLAAGNVRLIDVRTDEEVAEGMIPGAEHFPLDQFDPAKLRPSDGRAVVLYCRSGKRSTMAGEKLAAATGQPVEHLAGGILAWEEAGQPIAPR
jgi:rhodanese-related sulfurtransferase